MVEPSKKQHRFYRLERWVNILQELDHKGSSEELAGALNCVVITFRLKFHQLEEYGLAEIAGYRRKVCGERNFQSLHVDRIPIYGLTWRGRALLQIMLEGQRDNGREK